MCAQIIACEEHFVFLWHLGLCWGALVSSRLDSESEVPAVPDAGDAICDSPPRKRHF